MDILGEIIQRTSWGNWLFLCLLFGALAFLFRIIPIKELPWRRSSGGYTSSYTFRRAVHFGSFFAFSVSLLCLLGLIGARTGLWKNEQLAEVFGVFFFACLLLLVIPLYRKSSSYLKGTEGEGLVERELKKLSQDFFVFHDFPTGRGNIDHLVIGPTGVFAIETKNWKGKPFFKEGKFFLGNLPRTNWCRQASAGAIFINSFLKSRGLNVFVSPVLCLVGKESQSFQGRLGNVEILGLVNLIEFLSLRNFSLKTNQIEKAISLLCDFKKQNERQRAKN